MTGLEDPFDLLSVAAIVGAALSFLLYRLFRPAPPACHTLANAGGKIGAAPGATDVIVGASLAKGLKRAQQKARVRAA